ncbi:hypothetical protein [Skermania piniformis]|uniref:Uncharacterized protein n=1 Tax=Skermania pinensis TaxID=39122 RepID=A0ABX8S729_9ACTN|nr:hypothetical protein [Skermania piniformis]QXQ12315.1 hypothetical protein KV203_09890 [Skermania piniformis]
MMAGGGALHGVVTATLAAWLVDRADTARARREEITQENVGRLGGEIAALREEVRRLGESLAPRDAG